MKLTNRGIISESNPPALELTKGEIAGKYRGTNWRNHYPRHVPVTQPMVDLKARSVAYCTSEPIDAEASLLCGCYENAATPKAVSTTTEAVSTVSSRQQVLDELNNTHLTNIRHNLEHRLQVARAKGDQNLIRLLEAEAEQII